MTDTVLAPAPSPTPSSTPAPPTGPGLMARLRPWLPAVVLVVLVLAVSAAQPSFLGRSSLIVLAEQSVPILLLGLGQMFVVLTGGIDLSSAAIASLATVVFALSVPDVGAVAVLLTLVVTSAIGAVNGLLVAWGKAPSFIITIGTLGVVGAGALALSGASTIYVTEADGFGAVSWLYQLGIGGLSTSVYLALGLVVVTWLLMRYTPRGRSLHVLGLNERTAVMSGLPVTRLRVLAFSLSGLMAGLAGLVLTAQQQSAAPQLADSLLLPSIAAAVVGGCAITGGIGGAWSVLVGALTIGVLRVGTAVAGIDPDFQQIMYGAIVVAAVALTLDRARLTTIK